jgi:hypothetical protein
MKNRTLFYSERGPLGILFGEIVAKLIFTLEKLVFN